MLNQSHPISQISRLLGLRIGEHSKQQIIDWLRQRQTQLHLADISAYLKHLQDPVNQGQERLMLSQLLTPAETFFMRDSAQMQLLRDTLIPQLVENRSRRNQCRLRLWSAACASGEEAYSLAILVNEVLEDYGGWQIDIIGSDINSKHLELARTGCYPEWSFRYCPPNLRQDFFIYDGQQELWHLKPPIKNQVRFLQLDLLQAELPDFNRQLNDIDLILCRNLFIYLNTEAISCIVDKLAACLTGNGILMTAHNEMTGICQEPLQFVLYPQSAIYQKSVAPATNYLPKPIETTSATGATISTETAPSSELDTAWQLANAGQLEQALANCQQLLMRSPFEADAHYLHAVIALEKSDEITARQALRKVLYLDKNHIAAYVQLIDYYNSKGENEAADRLRAQAIRILRQSPPQRTFAGLGHLSAAELQNHLKKQPSAATGLAAKSDFIKPWKKRQ